MPDLSVGSRRLRERVGAGSSTRRPARGGGRRRRRQAAFPTILPVDRSWSDEVSDAALFLASGEARFSTTHEICPDAGLTEV